MPVLLLWDIDGTILRSGGAGMRAMAKVATRLFGPAFTWEGVDPGGNLDPLIFAQAARNNRLDHHDQHHARFHEEYITQLAEELTASASSVQAMPGVVGTLRQLHQRADGQDDDKGADDVAHNPGALKLVDVTREDMGRRGFRVRLHDAA